MVSACLRGGLEAGKETAEPRLALRIGRRGIEDGDAELQRFEEQLLRLVGIGRRALADAPHATDGDQSEAEPEARAGEFQLHRRYLPDLGWK